ncbi:hypothetical protein AN958_08628 [Leucoagaricus sp. SymC.cos]|nr:hypothetical protein AN958_08628 [Leucoagaricus sp. SymC.cos]
MASPQPILLTCLKLPPDEQLFFRLRAILLTILEKFHQLDLALHAARTRADIPGAERILVSLRVHTAHHSTDLINAAEYAKGFGKRFIQLAESMATPAATKEIHDKLLRVSNWADITARQFRDGEKQMKKVSEEIEPTVRQLTAVLDKSGPDATSLVLTRENLEAVNEFKQLAEEYTAIHGKIIIYFEEMERTFDPKNFQGGSPSGEEIAMVRERWQEFMRSVTDLQGSLDGIHTKINAGPNVADALRLAREGAAEAGTAVPASNPDSNRKAIMDSSDATGGTTMESRRLRQTLRTRLRAFSHRFLSCVSLKHFG